MPRETLSTRMTRLESTMAELADLTRILMAAQIKTEERFQTTEERMEKLASAQIKTEERFQATDERIEKLVSAIGELIRRNGRSHK